MKELRATACGLVAITTACVATNAETALAID